MDGGRITNNFLWWWVGSLSTKQYLSTYRRVRQAAACSRRQGSFWNGRPRRPTTNGTGRVLCNFRIIRLRFVVSGILSKYLRHSATPIFLPWLSVAASINKQKPRRRKKEQRGGREGNRLDWTWNCSHFLNKLFIHFWVGNFVLVSPTTVLLHYYPFKPVYYWMY